MIVEDGEYLKHYGIIRRSGRYPWGSGDNPYQRSLSFYAYVDEMKSKGLTEAQIAKGIGASSSEYAKMTSTDLRATRAIASNTLREANTAQVLRMKEKGMHNQAIADRLGISEPTVRNYLKPGARDRENVLMNVANSLKDDLDAKGGYIDVGSGAEHSSRLGVTDTRLKTALAVLEAQGYSVHVVGVPIYGTGNNVKTRVLAPPGVTYREVANNLSAIRTFDGSFEDNGRSLLGLVKPKTVDPKRLQVIYAEDGGSDSDGVVFVRPGVTDLDMGGSRYAQVRISVNDTHFIKGMAVHKDDLPAGVDLQFHTNKSDTGNKLDALKPMEINEETNKIDWDNPFGSSISRQIIEKDSNGKEFATSAMNIVNEDANWETWSNTLSAQMLSKQSNSLAKTQLDLAIANKKAELEEIKSLTNSVVRSHLLESFADEADSSSVYLKAASLPRQATQVILPVNSLKDNQVYAPGFENGERVVLIRYPHGGIFEIPELVVNNNNREGKKLIGSDARTAIGINSKVASHLSGADFDGDTVLVIPDRGRKIKTMPSLEGLKNFDPQRMYPYYDGMKRMSKKQTQSEMGKISNLITDMTLKHAQPNELARAVRHSMVVIDAAKHGLNYKQSYDDNTIKQLKIKYQGGPNAGASTLISRAKGRAVVDARPLRPARDGGPIDPATGKLMYGEAPSWIGKDGDVVVRKRLSKKLAETDDAHTLSSGLAMEKLYADHSNQLKAMANEARKVLVNTTHPPTSVSAKRVYQKEVDSLMASFRLAERKAPLERQARIIADANLKLKKQANPEMDRDQEKKIANQALAEARIRLDSAKPVVQISDREWQAIQAGAVSPSRLTKVLRYADLTRVRELATPKTQTAGLSTARVARAKAMINSGYTWAEVAEALGVSVSTLKTGLG